MVILIRHRWLGQHFARRPPVLDGRRCCAVHVGVAGGPAARSWLAGDLDSAVTS